jgi:hypothetical protein
VTFSENGFAGIGGPGLQADLDWGGLFDNVSGASLGNALSDNAEISLFKMEFSTTVRRAGLLMSTEPITSWTLEAYDANDVKLTEVTRSMPAEGEARSWVCNRRWGCRSATSWYARLGSTSTSPWPTICALSPCLSRAPSRCWHWGP